MGRMVFRSGALPLRLLLAGWHASLQGIARLRDY
jgi:hypothetical protein